MKALLVCAALAAAAPAFAQADAPEPAPAAAPASVADIDPARLALARTAVDVVWPTGTYERMMRGSMATMIDAMMESAFDMKVGDIAGGAAANRDPELARRTLRDVMAKEDAHFLERLRITNKVVFEEMIPVVNRIEPSIREGLALLYARKFTAAQLEELNRFLATPTGRAYAPEAMMAFVEPEITSRMTALVPEMAKEMPRIMEKVKAATAHLPPPPQRHAPARH